MLFKLPKTVAADCYQRVFQSFSCGGCLERELRNVHMDDSVESADGDRYEYLDEFSFGPGLEDLISFLSASPKLSRRE